MAARASKGGRAARMCGSPNRAWGLGRRFRTVLLAGTALQACAALAIAPPLAAQPAPNAQPTGGRVVAGAAAIAQGERQTTIRQTSQRAAVDWASFDVGRQQTVTFQQPSSSAVTLNRVTGPDPSQIAGRIQANGQIVLTNQSGVMFARGAQVDTAGLIVSAAGIGNRNFMRGRMVFDQPAKADAKIVNQGAITVREAGLAALVAPQVANSGTISARLGHVVLAAGRAATLDLYGDGLVKIDVTRQVTTLPAGSDGKPAAALVTNTGAIMADGGTVQLTAAAMEGVVANLVTAGGQIRTASTGARRGAISVEAVGGGATVTGTLAAEGSAPATAGGHVRVGATGPVAVLAGARISVAGSAGGGTVTLGAIPDPTPADPARTAHAAHVGNGGNSAGGPGRAPDSERTSNADPARYADRAGKTDRVRNTPGVSTATGPTATGLNVQTGATVIADATAVGRGGTIALLSGGATRMDGVLSARGGPNGGGGGSIDMSGKALGVAGRADASAAAGRPGSIMLDPDVLTILPGSGVPGSGQNGSGGGAQDAAFTAGQGTITSAAPSIGANTISNTVIDAFAGDVLLQAGKVLTVAGDLSLTGTPRQSLTLQAGGTITVNAGVVITASGDVVLATGGAGPGTPPAAQPSPLIAVNGTIGSTGGFVSLLAGVGGAVAISAPGSVAAGTGQRLTVQADSMTTLSGPASLVAPGGMVEIAPASVRAVQVQGSGGLAVSSSVLAAIDAAVLRVGAATVGGTLSTTASAITGTGTLSFPGRVDFRSTGAVSGGVLNVGTISGVSASFSGVGASGAIAAPGTSSTVGVATPVTIGSYRAGGLFSFAGTPGITVAGPLTAGSIALSTAPALPIAPAPAPASPAVGSLVPASPIVVIGTISATGAVSITSDAAIELRSGAVVRGGTITLAGGAIQLADGATLGRSGSVLDLSTTTGGDVTEAANAIMIGASLRSTGGGIAGSASLGGQNTIASVGNLAVGGGLLLTDLRPLTVIGTLAAAGTIRSGAVTIEAGGSVLAPGQTLAIETNRLSIGPSGTLAAGVLELAPSVVGQDVTLGAAGGLLASTDRIDAGVIRVGGITLPGGATVTRTGTITLAGDFGTAGTSLELLGTNAIVQDAGRLTARSLAVSAPGSVSLPQPNAVASLGGITAGAFLLNDGALAVAGPVTARDVSIGVVGPMSVAGSITAAGTVTLVATGGLAIGPGALLQAGTLDLSGAGGIVEHPAAAIRTAHLRSDRGIDGDVELAGTANAIGAMGSLAVANGIFSLVNAAPLSVQGPLSAARVDVTTPGLLTVGGPIMAAGAINLAGDGIAIQGGPGATGSVTAGGDVTLSAASTLAVAGSVSVGSGHAIGLRADAIALNGTVSAPGGQVGIAPATQGAAMAIDTARRNGMLSLVQRDLDAIHAGTLVLGAVPGEAALAGAIEVPGPAMLTRVAVLSLQARGDVGGSGAIGVATLTGQVGGLALDGPNAIGTLANLDASGGLALSNTIPLAVTGLVTAPSITLRNGEALALSGTVRGGSVALTAAAIDLAGLLTANQANLTATRGGISGGGQVAAGTLTGSASSEIRLTGPNQVATLGSIEAPGGFFYHSASPLSVAGTVRGGPGIALTSDAALAVAGKLDATQVSVAARSIVLDGEIAGAAQVALAADGPVGGGGIITTARLTGSAGSLDLSRGANRVGAIGDFVTSGGFALTSGPDLAVTGALSDGVSVTLAAASTLSVTGAIRAPSVRLTAGGIEVTGEIAAPVSLSLTAATSGIQAPGRMTAASLSGSAGTSASLTGVNTIDRIGSFTAGEDITLADTASLTVEGAVTAGRRFVLTVPGSVSIVGMLNGRSGRVEAGDVAVSGAVTGSESLAVVATAGDITGGGAVRTASLSGHAAGALDLPGRNQIAALDGFTADRLALANQGRLVLAGGIGGGTSVAISNAGSISASGVITGAASVSLTSNASIDLADATISGGRVALQAAQAISIAGGGFLTGGSIPSGPVGLAPGPLGEAGAGLLLSAPRIVQTGTVTIGGSPTPVAAVRSAGLVDLATLVGPQTWLILDLQSGRASAGNLTLRRLDVFYAGNAGSATLAGTIGGLTGADAAEATLVSPQPSISYTLNGCPIGSANCILLVRDPVPVQRAPQTLEFAVPRIPTDDPEILRLIPNVARQDY